MTRPERPPRTLTDALRGVAEADASLGASPAVEARLHEAVRAMQPANHARPSVTFLALAAALVVVVSGAWRLVVMHPPATGQAVMHEVATDFLPLTYADVPITDWYIVRLEVPRSALLLFGLASAELPPPGHDMIDADVLVGMDGIARAVRFVHQVPGGE